MAAATLISKLVCEQCNGAGVRLAALAEDLGLGPASLCPGCGGGGLVSRRDVRLLARLAADDPRGVLTRLLAAAAEARGQEGEAGAAGDTLAEMAAGTLAFTLESAAEALRAALLPTPPRRRAGRVPVAA